MMTELEKHEVKRLRYDNQALRERIELLEGDWESQFAEAQKKTPPVCEIVFECCCGLRVPYFPHLVNHWKISQQRGSHGRNGQ